MTTALSKPQPKVGIEPSDAKHWELYKCSLQALLSGESFEVHDPDRHGVYRMEPKEELQMLRHLSWLAYNAATIGLEIYRRNKETSAFNQKLGQ